MNSNPFLIKKMFIFLLKYFKMKFMRNLSEYENLKINVISNKKIPVHIKKRAVIVFKYFNAEMKNEVKELLRLIDENAIISRNIENKVNKKCTNSKV